MSLTIDDIVQGLQAADAAFDVIGPEVGAAELKPLADGLTSLLTKVTAAIEGKGTSLAAEVSGAEAAADALEDVKLGTSK